ncbi:hybrid sensor histidine kinase/response regulator [Komarekiella sp. 'clone 1']|uniref:histidine kinase n=1 Tax=Komarekiella delphini-convector SJRDD-AB1 TaxID=2593771 RepID=A0AA40STI8_9NOST|nr:ATP-binding protein [Komarekiella delphini-convector]MBD6614722.1 hybrid sensor histidine kinase/response regulator [Komarekiella delphini-convector SJRDD-AB1]
MKEKILVVEDEIIVGEDIKYCLEKSGYTVPDVAIYGKQAIESVAKLHPDLVLIDVMIKGDVNGIETAEEIVNRFNIPVVYLTDYSDNEILQKAKSTQPFGYIFKPLEETQLITTIEIALNKHQTEMVMRDALEREKEIRKIKSRFISMISHEFRNPLSNIFTYSEVLANYSHQLNEVQKCEYILHIQKSVKHLEHLLSDVLLIGKAETCSSSVNAAPLDLENLCKDLVTEIQFNTDNNHKIIFTIQEGCRIIEDISALPNSLLTPQYQLPCLDEKLLRHILTNLLINALKYSPQGGTVHFDLFCVQGEAIFRIQDEGIGIPETDQENLFNSFYRGSNVGKIPGHGLGLAIVKHYVELHGGEITFASKVGRGTTFIVSVPFQNN